MWNVSWSTKIDQYRFSLLQAYAQSTWIPRHIGCMTTNPRIISLRYMALHIVKYCQQHIVNLFCLTLQLEHVKLLLWC